MQRPSDFDSRVLAHIPMLERMAARFCHPNEREEVVQETIARVLEKWEQFREDGSFYKWLQFRFRDVCDMRKTRKIKMVDDPEGLILASMSTQPQQENIVYAKQVVRRLSRTREGRMLVRIGGGEKLKDIAAKRGIGKERVRQLTEKARARLVKSTKVAA